MRASSLGLTDLNLNCCDDLTTVGLCKVSCLTALTHLDIVGYCRNGNADI